MNKSLFNNLMKGVADPNDPATKVRLKVINPEEKIREIPKLANKLHELGYKQKKLLQITFSATGKQNLVMAGSLTDIKKVLRARKKRG
jgi:hypothetical protein